MAISYSSSLTMSSGFSINMATPVDVRTVVDTVDDLITIPKPYIGLLVNIKGTSDIYVLIKGGLAAKKLENWIKVGGTEFKPEDYVEYYKSQLGSKVLSSADDLSSISSPYEGQFAVVKDNPDTSENESGLYVYVVSGDNANWLKIISGSSAGSGNVDSVITTDGTIPSSGDGISISKNDASASVVETYANSVTELAANTYYTSRGLNSYDDNGGSLSGEDYIILSNGGESYIKLYSKTHASGNWIELCIKDDTLGITKSDVKYVDTSDVEHTMEDDTLTLPKEGLIRFAKALRLTGLAETRSTGGSELKFGSTGSTYEDIDIYTSNTLPVIYAYANGTQVKVLTEADIPETISNNEIDSLFDNI